MLCLGGPGKISDQDPNKVDGESARSSSVTLGKCWETTSNGARATAFYIIHCSIQMHSCCVSESVPCSGLQYKSSHVENVSSSLCDVTSTVKTPLLSRHCDVKH